MPSEDSLAAAVGRAEGRLEALEGRVDREVDAQRAALVDFRDESRVQYRDLSAKVDVLISRLDRSDGESAHASKVTEWARPIASGIIVAGAMLLLQHLHVVP